MATIKGIGADWSDVVTLTTDETLQAVAGTVIIHFGDSPANTDDGIHLPYPLAIDLDSGQQFRYRSDNNGSLHRAVRA